MHVARILARNRRQTDFADLTFHEALRPVSATVRFRNSRKFVPHSTDRGQALCRILSRARHSFPGCPCWNRLRILCTAGATLIQPSLAPVTRNFPSGIRGKKIPASTVPPALAHPGRRPNGPIPLPSSGTRSTHPQTSHQHPTGNFLSRIRQKTVSTVSFSSMGGPSIKKATHSRTSWGPPPLWQHTPPCSGQTTRPPPKRPSPGFATQQPKSEDPYTQTLHWLG